MMRGLFLVLALVAAAAIARADVPVRSAEPGMVGPPATVSDFGWLQGAWVGTGLGGETEEAYSAPLAGTIAGYFRLVKDGKPVFYEFLTLVEREGSVVLRLKHFDPDLTGWEEKDKSVDFRLVAIEGQTAYFNGLTMKRENDTLFAAVKLRMKDGTVKVEQFSFKLRR